MIRGLLVAVVALTALSMGAIALGGTAAATPVAGNYNINGTWNCCGAGGASVQLFNIDGSSGFNEFTDGAHFATLNITQNGDDVTILSTYTNSSYVATFKGTVSNNGNTMSGTWTSNADQVGTWTATSADHFDRQSSSVVVAPIASSLGTPGEIFHSVKHNLVNAAITVAVILFITFPANIFNSTFSSNYDEILLIVAGYRRRIRKFVGLKETPAPNEPEPEAPVTVVATSNDAPGLASPFWFAAVLVLGAIFGGLLNPAFGLNRATGAGFVSTLIAFAFGAAVSYFITRAFRQHHKYPTRRYLKALPLGLAVALVCVFISRVSGFQPGYLYGVVVSLSFRESLPDRHNAHLTAISTLSTLSVALTAWFLWVPVNHVALEHANNIPLAVVDNFLGSVFVGGLVGTVVGLFPIEFMPGRTLAKWRKDVWAVIFFVALFLLIEVELRPESGPTHPGSAAIVTVVVLFVLFGGATLWMRRFFAQRAKSKVELVHLDPPGNPESVPDDDALPNAQSFDDVDG